MAQLDIEGSTLVEAIQPSLRWGPIIAGWVVAVGIAFLLYVGGLAMGFTAFDPNDAAATAKGIGLGSALWLILTWIVSLFIGGLFASWFDGREDETTGVMHGVTVWGLSIAASGLLLALGMGGAIGSGATLAAAGSGMQQHHGMRWDAGAARDSQSTGSDAKVLLQAQLLKNVRAGDGSASATPPLDTQNGATQMAASPARPLDGRTATAVTAALLANHAETAKALLAANTDMSPSDINATVQGLSPQVSEAQAHMKAAADKAAHYAAMAMWVLFLSIVLSLLAAALGGWLGASHVHRVYHLRRYTRSVPMR